ncbi:MAG: hypothetical protein ABSC94_31105 [Polyangiaceae bacterium]
MLKKLTIHFVYKSARSNRRAGGGIVAVRLVGGLHHRHSRAASLPNEFLATTGRRRTEWAEGA